MKKLLLFMTSLLLISCDPSVGFDDSNASDDNVPYYAFTQQDIAKLVALEQYQSGTTLAFKNQDNQTLEFIVHQSLRTKELESSGSFWTSYTSKVFYYDEQVIKMYPVLTGPPHNEYDYEATIQIKQLRWPVTYVRNHAQPPSEASTFTTNIGLFAFKNNTNVVVNYNENLYTMTYNGVTYKNVHKLSAFMSETQPNTETPLPELRYVYYAENIGVIGFDDTQGKEWRLQ